LFLQEPAAGAAAGNIFDAKTEKGSAELYFHYYGMLMHQQNMLQVRPSSAPPPPFLQLQCQQVVVQPC
jgi:hypothetical protein